VVVGVLAATDGLVRQAGPPDRDVKFFYIIPLSDMLIFATLIFFAFRARSNPSAQKRLMLVGTSRVDDRRSRSLANRTNPQNGACRGAGLLHLPNDADGL
jgi:hypothetical protein